MPSVPAHTTTSRADEIVYPEGKGDWQAAQTGLHRACDARCDVASRHAHFSSHAGHRQVILHRDVAQTGYKQQNAKRDAQVPLFVH
jgi:hypothetical protein